MLIGELAAERPAGGRRVAGQDPEKRRKILAGARQVFATMGFDAASMNDITCAAGVSKGTLYVYFENKERLFLALIEEERERQRRELFGALDEDPDVAHALSGFGRRLVRLLVEPRVLRAKRVVIGVVERMGDVGRHFYEAGPLGTCRHLAAYLETHAEAAGLDIPDAELAAAQFLALVQVRIVDARLYAHANGPPEEGEVERVVDAAVRLFLRGHARAAPPRRTTRS